MGSNDSPSMEAALQDERQPGHQDERQPGHHAIDAIGRLFDHLGIGLVVSGGMSVALEVARHLPWTCLPVVTLIMIMLVNVLYLIIYKLEVRGIVDNERRKNLVKSVQWWCPVVENLFE